ncbi:retrovirus-related pol polyprotein from transposon TNT 1-94 [Tanacetum coccineum]
MVRIVVVQIVLWIVDSGCSKHMTGDRCLSFLDYLNFFGRSITGYGDYIQGNITICHVYYVEGLGHNLFSVGQFCDGDLEVAFRSKTCYVRNMEFTKGIVDPTLFTRRHGEDILLVQVYVDDIIFGSTNSNFSKRFANLMEYNFEMSMMGELKFFLGLQVHQSPRGIFISQSQYAIELLKKHGLDECVFMSIPMATERLDANLQGTPTDQTTYRRMIGGLMYLTTSHLEIAYATFVCASYQARPMVKHLKEMRTMQDVKTTVKAHQEDCNF